MNALTGSRRIILTGASGGLGRALALHHAAPGASLSLWGRDMARLESLADTCRAAGAEVQIRSFDLADGPGAVKALLAEDESAPFDMAFLVAGLGDIRAPGTLVEDPALVLRLGQVNFTAPAAMAAALADRMARRGSGRIVLIGSAAGYHALPFAAAYAASKAGLARFADALRIAVKPHGVGVTLVAPGFIDTAAGRAVPGGKPLLLSPREAARRISRAAMRGKAHYTTPWPFAVLRIIDRILPRALRDPLLRRLGPPGQ